jgi:hypothetical protein
VESCGSRGQLDQELKTRLNIGPATQELVLTGNLVCSGGIFSMLVRGVWTDLENNCYAGGEISSPPFPQQN